MRVTVSNLCLVDGSVSESLSKLISQTISMSMKLAAVVLFTPIFIIPGVFMAILGGYCGQIYIKAQLSVKRELSVARTPVLGHFGAAMAGLGTVVHRWKAAGANSVLPQCLSEHMALKQHSRTSLCGALIGTHELPERSTTSTGMAN